MRFEVFLAYSYLLALSHKRQHIPSPCVIGFLFVAISLVSSVFACTSFVLNISGSLLFIQQMLGM